MWGFDHILTTWTVCDDIIVDELRHLLFLVSQRLHVIHELETLDSNGVGERSHMLVQMVMVDGLPGGIGPSVFGLQIYLRSGMFH